MKGQKKVEGSKSMYHSTYLERLEEPRKATGVLSHVRPVSHRRGEDFNREPRGKEVEEVKKSH